LQTSIKGPGNPGAFIVSALYLPTNSSGVSMRKPFGASTEAGNPPLPVGHGDDAAMKVVCFALALAVVVLAFRIVTIL
jgi:hypothetical protein